MRGIRGIDILALFGIVALGLVPASHAATDLVENDDAELKETLEEINDRFNKVEVQILKWPDELRQQLGNLKECAFMAYPENKPSGKLPLVIALHGAGGKEMSLQKQLSRSSEVKGLALAELAGKDLILLEPNSSDSWDPDTLDRMLDYVLETNENVDKSRVYVMGHSMGGSGAWAWILQSADRFAAAAPCGFGAGASPDGVERLVELPIWGMVGGDDGDNVAAIQAMADNLRAAGNVNVRHTAFSGFKHSQGNAAVFSSVELVDWMLGFSIHGNSSSADGGDWPSWRGPYGNGIAEAGQTLPTEWSETKHVQWKASVPGRGHSTPIVVGDRVFLTTAREQEGTQSVLCYSFSSGELLWEKILIEGSLPERIHKKNTHASPSVACDGERIYALFFVAGDRLHLFSLDLNGNELWRKDAGRFYPERHFGYGSSPLLAGGNVVVSSESEGEGFIAAFDCDTGKEAWRTIRMAERSSYGTPVLADINGSAQIVLNGADRVASYDPESGRELWSVPGGDLLIANTVLWKDGVVFASGGYPGAETWAIDVENRKAIWSSPVKCYEQSLLLVGDHLYGVAEGGLAHCWDIADGNMRWRERLPKGPESASPVLAGGYIFHANEEGKIFVIKPNPDKLELIAENQLGDEIFATPVICRDRILLRVAKYEGEARSETLYSIGF